MALIDLQSDLTWTGNVPPGVVNYSLNNSAIQNNTSFTDEYTKFKVRDEAYNATGYFRQPFILRGIQRNSSKRSKPERWGIGTAIGEPFIRGGVTTVADRVISDEIRIGKLLAKPQGLLFLSKQVGLQLSNPNVESALGVASLPFAQATKIFTPVNLLANIAGNPFGLHFKRHGVTPIGGAMSYTFNTVQSRPTDDAKTNFNRLVNLKRELFKEGIGTSGIIGKLTGFAENFLGASGTPIMTLTGVTGPSSVYGAGITTMRRTADTSLINQLPLSPIGNTSGLGDLGKYIGTKQYTGKSATNLKDRYLARGTSDPNVGSMAEELWSRAKKSDQTTQLKLSGKPRSITTPTGDKDILGLGLFGDYNEFVRYPAGKDELQYLKNNGSIIPISNADQELAWIQDKNASQVTQLDVDGDPNDVFGNGNSPDDTLSNNILDNNATTIQKYSAVAYGNIPKTPSTITPNDFREDGAFQGTETPFIGNPAIADYAKNNLDTKYSIGDPGRTGLDRTDSTNASSAGNGEGVDKVNNLQFGQDYEDGNAKDLVKFIIKTATGQPIIFRSFITALNDNFNPSYRDVRLHGHAQANQEYDTFSREISVSFLVAAQSREEMENLWNKLDKLAQLTMPVTLGGLNYKQSAYLTIGNMYNNLRGNVSNLSYDWDQEAPWDVDYETPMYTTVDMSFDIRYDETNVGVNYGAYKVFNALANITYK